MAKDSDLRDSVNELINNNFVKRILIAPNIPEKQLRNAIASMGIPNGSDVLVLVDDTFTKSGKGGICVTSDGIYWKKTTVNGVKFDEVKQLKINLGFWTNFKINGEEIAFGHFSREEIEPFADFLLKVLGFEPTLSEVMHEKEAESSVETPTKEQTTEEVMGKETEAQKARVESLTKTLEDPQTDGNNCLEVVNELGQIGNERAIRVLLKAFPLGVNSIRGRKDLIGLMEVSVDWAIHQVLTRIDKPVLEEAILRALKSGNKDEAHGAAFTTASFGIKDSRAIEPLIAAIDGKGPYSSDYAGGALESIGEPAVGRLNRAFNDESKEDVHERIRQILSKIRQKRYEIEYSKSDTAK